MPVLLARLLSLFRKRALDARLDEEVQFHLAMETEANRKRGLPEQESALQARRAFGGEQKIKEAYRDQRGLPMIELLCKDLHYGLRTFRRNPGFTAIAALSLALGIGANTAIFTLIDGIELRSLPVRAPQELVAIGDPGRPGGVSNGGVRVDLFSYPLYQRLQQQNQAFTGLLGSGRTGRLDVSVDGGGEEPIRGRLVSANYFDVLGVQPSLGRAFTPVDDQTPGASPFCVISYDYWESRFARDPAIPGRVLKLNGSAFTVIGVGPRDFTGEVVGAPSDVWIPLSMQAQINPGDARLTRRDSNWLLLLGRLKQGVTVVQARAEISTLTTQALIEFAGSTVSADRIRVIRERTVNVQSGRNGFSGLRKRFERPLIMLMAVVGLVLLIACANVANLLLARAAGRQKEISVRLAVGASRSRLIRQLLTESLLLSAIGGGAGLLLASAGSGALLHFASDGPTPIPLDLRPDRLVLAFTAGVSILTGILFGLAPALRSTRVDLAGSLKESARGVTGSEGWQIGKLLVVAQVALSLVLLVGAGLFIRSLVNLETLDAGYSRSHLAVLGVDPLASGYPAAGHLPMMRRILDRLSQVPGVVGVTVSENGIFSGTDSSSDGLRIDGFTSTRREDFSNSFDQVGPHYFQVVGVPVLAGRDFDDGDRAGTQPVTILNETMTHFYFGNKDPIGKLVVNGNDRYTVVGVVKDMKERDLKGKAERRFYLPYFQITDAIEGFHFEVRTRDDAAALLPAIRRAMQSYDANLKVLSLEPVRVLIDRSITEEHLIAQLSGFFGVLALLLAATGLYGVMAYATSRRANEIGLRMALGADRASVVRMVLRETLVLVAVGIAIGWPVALMAARGIEATLVGLSPNDPATLAAATTVMLLVAVLAGWIPARRASNIDPATALRQD